MYLSIVIPCYNEFSRGSTTYNIKQGVDTELLTNSYCLENRLRILKDFCQNLKDIRYDNEVIIIDDGSVDGSEGYINSFIQSHELENWRCIRLNTNTGKANALRQGIKLATGEFTLLYDADMSVSIDTFLSIQPLLNSNTCIVGSRYCNNGVIVNKRSLLRKAVSKIARDLLKLSFGVDVSDTQCGFKVFPTDKLKLCTNFANAGWMLDIELLYCMKILNVKIREFGVTWNNLESESTLKLSKALRLCWTDYISLMSSKKEIQRILKS